MNLSVDEIIEQLQQLNLSHNNIDWIEDLPTDFCDSVFANNYEEVASGLDVDTHRWYEISTSVIRINGEYLGIRHVSNLFSESMDVSDTGADLEFFKMKEVTVTSYEKA